MKFVHSKLLWIAVLLHSISYAQIVDGNGYMIGTYMEVAIDGDGGHEGTADLLGHHSRGGTAEVPFGLVGTNAGGWGVYDGEFLTAGTPENGFGIEINGINYSNNSWNSGTSDYFLQEIPKVPGSNLTYSVENDCQIIVWQGKVAGVRIEVKYTLRWFITNGNYYTTEVTLTNETGSALNDVYYYRNLDPDNNHSLTGAFETTNKIVSQSDGICHKAFVTATQATPRASLIGLCGIGENFRVSHGGYSNRSGSDIWNAAGGLEGTVGATNTADDAISLAYKTNLNPGESVSFTYAVLNDKAQSELHLAGEFNINYDIGDESGGAVMDDCDLLVINTCVGDTVLLDIEGPYLDYYDWTWALTGEENDSLKIVLEGGESDIVVVGTPNSDCFDNNLRFTVKINFSKGPKIEFELPDPICGEYDLTLFEYWDLDDGENTNCTFLTAPPDSATQTEPAFVGPMMDIADEIWLMCGDSITGCYDNIKIEFNFVGPDAAGPDTIATYCSGPGTVISLKTFLTDSSNIYGRYEEITDSDQFDDSLGIFYASGLFGTFEFMYIVEGFDPCLDDTAFYTIILEPRPFARFKYMIDGVIYDGISMSACSISEIDFINTSTIDEPFEITWYHWDFGDGDTSDLFEPSHLYDGPGTYVVSLKVYSENGCTSPYSRSIIIYDQPNLELVFSEPLCNGSEDGVIIAEIDIPADNFIFTLYDEDGNLISEGDAQLFDSLGVGTYTVIVMDSDGCGDSASVTLEEPPPLFAYYRIYNPPCAGDYGYAVIDSIIGESFNNPVTVSWDPNPIAPDGIDIDSMYKMPPGDYTVTMIDSKGCTGEFSFSLYDPPPFYFTDWGWDTAYCRLFDYQSGNGFVYAAAAGGLTPYVYEWTYLVDGSHGYSSTWGGRNPGDHLITVTDAGGCQLTKTIHVDSVNPIAAFTILSDDLNENMAGTAPVEIEVVNHSSYYANPNNPIADTTFFWDLDRTDEVDWIITHDFYATFDTIYLERGASYDVNICLIAFNKNGCSDTACQIITIWEPPVFNIVNVFSPNGDGANDYLTFENYAKGIRDFQCIIVNRWGVQVGEINSITGYWDGTDFDGQLCPDGVYFYTYTATADNGVPFSGQGNVTLVSSGRE